MMVLGTVEESMYKKQIFKHYLSQKILSDPRQRRKFLIDSVERQFPLDSDDQSGAEYWSGLEELFRTPPEPPGWAPRDRGWIKEKWLTGLLACS